MEITTWAPIYIPTLNRYEHLKRLVESLERCSGAEHTDVYIGLDYPPSEKYVEGWKKTDAYLAEKEKNNAFKNFYVRRRDHNCGVGNSTSNGILLKEEIRKKYDRYIMSEDDNEFSPNFLEYMNWALEYFKDDQTIYAVCSYNQIQGYKLDINGNVYKTNRAYCAWGYGQLFDRLEKFRKRCNFEYMESWVKSLPLSTIFSDKIFLAASVLYMLKERFMLGDTVMQLIPKEERYCVYPTVSKTRNWGHDGSGLHGGSLQKGQITSSLPIDESSDFVPKLSDPIVNASVEKAFQDKYGKKPLQFRIRSVVIFVWYKLTGKIISLNKPKFLKKR